MRLEKKLSNSLRGKLFSKERTHNISVSLKGKKKAPRNEEYRRNIGISHSKRILCTTTGIIYSGQREAAKKLNISQGSISQCCNGTRNFAGKSIDGTPLVWRFIDVEKMEKERICWEHF